jgi:hypothetical protein
VGQSVRQYHEFLNCFFIQHFAFQENPHINVAASSNWDSSNPLLRSRRSRDILFLDNTVETTGPATIWLGASSKMEIASPRFHREPVQQLAACGANLTIFRSITRQVDAD